MYALEQSVYKCLAKLSFLRVFVNLASRRTEKKRTIQTRCESWKFRGKTREATLWGIAYPRGIRLVERVKGDWGPMEVRNANKLSIVFECDIMSRYSFSCGHKRKKKSSMLSSDFFFYYKKKRSAVITRSFSVLENLFEIIIQPEVFYKCMENDELAFPRDLNIYLFNSSARIFLIIVSYEKTSAEKEV